MSPDKLIRMVNQIAKFFETSADNDPAAAIAEHINSFWEPRMRRQFLEIIGSYEGEVSPLVMAAVPLVDEPAPSV